jgi:hypothetical protein
MDDIKLMCQLTLCGLCPDEKQLSAIKDVIKYETYLAKEQGRKEAWEKMSSHCELCPYEMNNCMELNERKKIPKFIKSRLISRAKSKTGRRL